MSIEPQLKRLEVNLRMIEILTNEQYQLAAIFCIPLCCVKASTSADEGILMLSQYVEPYLYDGEELANLYISACEKGARAWHILKNLHLEAQEAIATDLKKFINDTWNA